MIRSFTSEELKPSEKTLHIIRQIAYTYRVIRINGKMQSLCLNEEQYRNNRITLTALCRLSPFGQGS